MSPKQQISVFQELFGTPRFNAVFQFYAGITKLRTSRSFLSKLPRFLRPVPASVYELVKKVIKRELRKSWGISRTLLISLLHCLYEAEDASLCMFVADLLRHELKLDLTTLSPLDCLSVGYFSSLLTSTVQDHSRFKLYLGNCSIGDQECKFLTRGFFKCLDFDNKVAIRIDLYLGYNNIHEKGIGHLADLLKKSNSLRTLNLSYNLIGVDGLKSLCEALSVSSTVLEELYLRRCSLTVSSETGSLLYDLLSTNTSLICLDLSLNKIVDSHQLAAGLSNNKTLKLLNLSDCGLTDENVEALATGLNNYIEELDIYGNDWITMEGINTIARCLSVLSGMRRLRIPKHLKFSINTAFSEVNIERRTNRLPDVKVTGKNSAALYKSGTFIDYTLKIISYVTVYLGKGSTLHRN